MAEAAGTGEFDQVRQAQLAEALAMCCAGDAEGGLARYQKVLNAYAESHFVPIGVHAHILESRGLAPLADRLRRVGVGVGADLCVAGSMGLPPQRAVDEYRGLFDRGLINAHMVTNFLRGLDQLGQTEELRARLDAARLTRTVALSDGGRWSEIRDLLLSEQVRREWREDVQSVRKIHLVVGLEAHPHPLIRDLMGDMGREIEAYLDAWRRSGHWVTPWAPRRPALSAWAHLSYGEGHSVPHFHPMGWVTCVCFIAAPAQERTGADTPGALRIGPPPGAQNTLAWPDVTIPAKPGVLVLMPSYLTHWTNPLAEPGLRISITMDANEEAADA
jgi:hypothetical protein